MGTTGSYPIQQSPGINADGSSPAETSLVSAQRNARSINLVHVRKATQGGDERTEVKIACKVRKDFTKVPRPATLIFFLPID